MTDRPLTSGMMIGGFRLEEKIHAGGMASLWRVTRDDIALSLAMKIPRLDSEESSTITCFEVEQMILPKLSGPHVPRFIAQGETAELPYLVMERVAGRSVDEVMRAAPLPAEEVAKIGARVAAALHDLHRQHVLHLDLTPDNILLRKNGEAVLIDFGLSRHEHLPDLMAEVFALPLGTAPYISPEQVMNVRSDPRSDIFSLGVVLYQLITKEFPFGDPKSMAGLKRRLYVDPDPPSAVNRACPRWLQEIILKCLEVDPARRYASAAQLAFALENPDQVTLTARSEKSRRESFWNVLRSLVSYYRSGPAVTVSSARHLDTVPIIMVAVDTSAVTGVLADGLREAVRKAFSADRNARLTCVTVRRTPRMGLDYGVDEAGKNLTVQYLVELKHWAQLLELPSERITFHVLESPDPADALVHYAKMNQVDHIIIGARGSSSLRRFMGSVSSQVVAEAPCSVTVVRIHEADDQRGDSAGYAGHG
jgi:serine/threonine protein kinase